MSRVSRVLPHLTAEEIQEKIRTTDNHRKQQKWWIVYNALVAPRPAQEIALHTGTTLRTVHQVISDYNRMGVAAIEKPKTENRKRAYLSLEEERDLLAQLEPQAKKGELTTKIAIKQAFENKVGHQVHKTTIYRLIERHDWRKIKPRGRHPKAKPEEVENFKDSFPLVIEQLKMERPETEHRSVILMAADEGRFGRTGEVRGCWCPKGFRPTIHRQVVRQYIYAYAAVAPALGRMSCLLLPRVDQGMMNLFLQQVSQEFFDYFIILQVDQAAWHRAKNLVVPNNIRLLFQPPYSPEVMPVEHLWDEIREKYFSNRLFLSLDKVEDTLCQALKELDSQPERLRSMTYFPHLRITV
ncbi:IS630 family transposase [Chroococcus sp. FPU101]|uniref:IS630 family transposase n=1 Tax=Chroococcus sp. FPU101 TaxID=1974212 RepID=UPI001A8D2FA7|nr:IS630 family transposase [Chroococcus sp. FPU101]GFE72342.1 hypothetical protein CFPU101_49520 [Chroococcus sp. FPU101]